MSGDFAVQTRAPQLYGVVYCPSIGIHISSTENRFMTRELWEFWPPGEVKAFPPSLNVCDAAFEAVEPYTRTSCGRCFVVRALQNAMQVKVVELRGVCIDPLSISATALTRTRAALALLVCRRSERKAYMHEWPWAPAPFRWTSLWSLRR